MKTTKKAPTSDNRLTTAVPPPNAASARTPDPAPMGIASVSPTIARMRRSSLTASRRSRAATSAALRGSNFGQITMVVHNREVDVLQRRQLAHLLAHLQTGASAQLDQVAYRKRAAGGHDPDVSSKVLGLFHAVGADDERAAFPLQILEIDPRARTAAGSSAASMPSTCNSPPLGRRTPAMQRKAVVFPAPLRPSRTRHWPSSTLTVRSWSASTSP